MSQEEWTVMCGDFAGRRRPLRVVVRGFEVVVVAPPGESAVLDQSAVAQLRSAVMQAVQVAQASASGAPGGAPANRTASTAEQYSGGQSPVAAGRSALPSYRGGTVVPTNGPAAIPATVVGEYR